ncbi:MAG TPA: hypothetical protein VHD56_05035 [Tepidisphaeraceae bacterium]|nr:hypothetical protein [Tepidisphaeraceae bacterium]
MNSVIRRAKQAGFACVLLTIAISRATSGVFYPDGARTLHFAFEGNPNSDRPVIRPPGFYEPDAGFGFIDSPTLFGTSRGVTAPRYFRFDVNLPDGNYDVTVLPGGTQGESVATFKAEGHRTMLLGVHAGSGGQALQNTFTVNVRHGGPGNALDSDGRLNLEFVGINPSMMKLDIKPNDHAITVYVVGDSLAADLEIPAAGWGQMLPVLFQPGQVAIANFAGTNQTAKSFIDSRGLDAVTRTMKAGDYLLVQFSDADSASLMTYIDEARKHHASIALVSSPSRKSQNVATVREIAQRERIPLIDLSAKCAAFLEKTGEPNSRKIYADDSNLTSYGALEVAKLFAQEIKAQNIELSKQLIEGLISSNFRSEQIPADLESRPDAAATKE